MSEFDYRELGLEPRDKIVYETLYKLDKVSLRSIAQETGMNRGTVYEVIKKLTSLGLITFTQVGERRYYSPAPPEVFRELIRERRDQLQQLEVAAEEYIRSLESKQPVTGPGYFASFYEGEEGVAAILRDVLQTMRGLEKREYCVFSSERASKVIYNRFRNFSRQRVKLGIFVRVISDKPPSDKVILAERRQLPAGRQFLNGYTLIYGDKTALISVGETNTLSAIVITDNGVANMQRLIFEQLWQSLESASQGQDQSQSAQTPTPPPNDTAL
ncbi:winged helix-turn-helix transcriptional regulator [Candidatus Saccharibacteria bacterium]|nr:winged helix-turn-helix transcriptional regulator [Candidatus Saccharibacteria bacterium]